MPHSFLFRFLFVSGLLSLNLTVEANSGNIDDLNWAKPGWNVEAGQIYIQVLNEAAPLTIAVYDGIVMTGNPDLDAVADAFGVYRIEKTYRMKRPPDDPSRVDLSRYYTVYFPEEYGPFDLIEAFDSCEEVVLAEFVTINRKFYIPNDERYEDQWHLPHCNLPDAWDVSHGSEEIVIGIVDTGLDMNIDEFYTVHEDFRANLWINEEEDIAEPFGEITDHDWNEEDDDDNDYTDDFHGWNFSHNSNWPDDRWGPENGHGTYVAGLASAATDNEVGISSPGFNCKLMITAHYDPDDPEGGLVRSYLGIEYCADNGADIINLSWGAYARPSQVERDVIDHAIQEGSIIFAAAGNDNREDREDNQERVYPCAYDGVIGVAASDDEDHKSGISDYGDHVDLVAPGVSMLSTFPRNDYDDYQGTSMSSPFVAGIAALMLSVEPDLNTGSLLEWMQRTAVDISDLNEDYPGIVYRVDAGYLLQSTKPMWELVEWSAIEVDGDGDGIVERNETIALALTLANEEGYADANNVVITLENDDEYVHITTGEVNIGDIDSGDEYDLLEDQYPVFNVAGHSPIHYSTFTLRISSDEDWQVEYELLITIRQPQYLLVDDDNGDDFETYYHDDMMQRPIVHDTWHISDDGLPSQELLDSYNFVVWETGNDTTPLTVDEQTLIGNYLDNDGYLLLSGQFIGDDIGESDFHRNYLKAQHFADNADRLRLSGADGHPITDGMDVLLVGDAGNGRLSPSAMEPINGAETILTYTGDDGYIGGVCYEGDYHLVYLGFALEAVGDGVGGTTSRQELLESILDRFYNLGVEGDYAATRPVSFEMGTPYPNPFNARTSVRVDVPYSMKYILEVLDLTGRRIDVLHDGSVMPGVHTYHWNTEGMPAGVYLFNLSWVNGSLVRKAVLVK